MKRLLINIKKLVHVEDQPVPYLRGAEMNQVKEIANAFLEIEDGKIARFGEMSDLHGGDIAGVAEVLDCEGKWVIPGLVDSHTHLVFAEPRAQEFEDRIHGLTYEEIAARGGGILNSAAKLADKPEEDLYDEAMTRLEEMIHTGTTGVEIKSGYGLTTEAELKMLRVAQRIKRMSPIPVRVTFLGAHAFPPEYKENKEGYIDLIINEMIPAVAREELADYIDVFCEKGYFDLEQTDRILAAGVKHGLRPKVHVNQFNAFGGIETSINHGALSVDHLEVMNPEDFDALLKSECMPVALPSCSFFLSIPYTPGRELIDKGLPLALATDYNPGSTPSGNLLFVWSLACIIMKLTPTEALVALTHNAAFALGLEKEMGSIAVGKRANLIISEDMNSLGHIPYHFGRNSLDRVIINGTDFRHLEP
ncbi:imidazolonepropionase [Phaeocystidibacter luteus]|uniref:Imidazolonepropionase n=1 Tax=Phaeocystidibacter luteus TaxID=911197 RepID=A0A6N6RGN3_9FLAO|nr:imidazolonepropionase [Phaeocystidibacter luteus]KAB2809903.1 imidazolonepropionase [Phaeocystidibacter luteus]